MTIPLVGPITMTAIAIEAGLPTSSPVNLNNLSVRALAGIETPDTTISYFDFRGKSTPTTYPNGSFTDITFIDAGGGFYTTTGWIIYLGRVLMNGGSTISGFPTPNSGNPDNSPVVQQPTLSYIVTTDLPAVTLPPNSHSIRLLSQNGEFENAVEYRYSYWHGPYLVSDDPIALYNGDTATFYWKAEGGQDAFDIFAYLLNTTTGATLTMADQTGSSQTAQTPWAPATYTINTAGGDAAGNYKFVFVSGSYDFTGGWVFGASLYITNIFITRAGPPGFFSSLVTYLSGYMSEFRNVNFYNYTLDGDQYYISDGGFDMYDGGNYTYPWFLSGADRTGLNYGQSPYLSYASSGTGTGSNYNPNSTVDTDFVYCGLGYSAVTNPLSMMAYRTTVGNPIGFQKSGDVGADGGGIITSAVIYNGTSINGFRVFAFYRQVSGATDPSVCDLYMILGHEYWGSVYGIFNTYANTTSTNSNGGYAYMSGAGIKNLLAIVTLLSKVNGVAVTVAEIQTVIAAWVSRIKIGLGYT